MSRPIAALLALMACCAAAPAQGRPLAACAPAGYARAELDALKASQWTIADDARRNAFAVELSACLGDADPAVRDGIAFEALQHLMRSRQLSVETLRRLRATLLTNMATPDPQGFRSSSVIMLSPPPATTIAGSGCGRRLSA